MPTVTRTFSITYAGVTIGGSSDYYLLHADEAEPPMRLSVSYDRLTLEAHVVCRSTTVSDFTTKANALETAFRTPASDLSYTFGSSTTSYSQSSNTGMNAVPSCEKMGSTKFDTDRSRLYRVSVTITLPADASGQNGLREGTIEVRTENNGRVTATITGNVTALSSASASAQTATAITALTSAVTTALATTMQAVEPRSYKYDTRNKIASFTHTLREIIFSESLAGLDHASIKDQQFAVERAETYDGDHDGNGQPVRMSVSYAASIDKSVTDLPAFWEATVKPWILSRLRATAPGGAFAITEMRPGYDLANNRITASCVMLACVASTWGRRITTRTSRRTATRLIPVHNGNPSARLKFETYETRRMSIEERVVRLGGSTSTGTTGATPGGGTSGFFGFSSGSSSLGQVNGAQSFGFFGAQSGGDQRANLGQINVGGAPAAGGAASASAPARSGIGGVQVPRGYELIDEEEETYPVVVGSADARLLTTVERRTQSYEYAEIVAPGSSGGGAGGGGRVWTEAR